MTGDSVLRGGGALVLASTLRRATVGVALLGGAVVGADALWPMLLHGEADAVLPQRHLTRATNAGSESIGPGAEPSSLDAPRVAAVDSARAAREAHSSESLAASNNGSVTDGPEPPLREPSVATPKPERDIERGVVRIPAASERTAETLRGRVVDRVGQALEGARIELAWLRAVSDVRGESALPLETGALDGIAQRCPTLAVVAMDGRMACTSVEAGNFGPYVLPIPDEAPGIAGCLVDAFGAPLAGVRVVLYDGTRTSSSATIEAPGAVGERGRSLTDDAGRFALEPLMERSYTLRFLREDPYFVLDSIDVPAGTLDLVVRVAADHFRPRLTGRAIDRAGRPLPGLELSLAAYECAPGVARTMPHSPRMLTDEKGHFELLDVPRGEVALAFHPLGGAWYDTPTYVPLEASGRTSVAGAVGDVVVDIYCEVSARLTEGIIGASLRFIDSSGEILAISEVDIQTKTMGLRAQQSDDGSFGRLFVPQHAVAVEVLDRDARVVRRAALELSSRERNDLEL